MKETKMKTTTTKYYRVRVTETCEEQVFSTRREAVDWMRKVAHTFGSSMSFELIVMTENTSRMTIDLV